MPHEFGTMSAKRTQGRSPTDQLILYRSIICIVVTLIVRIELTVYSYLHSYKWHWECLWLDSFVNIQLSCFRWFVLPCRMYTAIVIYLFFPSAFGIYCFRRSLNCQFPLWGKLTINWSVLHFWYHFNWRAITETRLYITKLQLNSNWFLH